MIYITSIRDPYTIKIVEVSLEASVLGKPGHPARRTVLAQHPTNKVIFPDTAPQDITPELSSRGDNKAHQVSWGSNCTHGAYLSRMGVRGGVTIE